MRVIKFNTLLRVVYTLGLSLILAQAAFAQTPQSVLNFAKTTVNERANTGFAVTNPTSAYADVTFTFYGFDGNPISSGLVNPVRYRVAAKGQLSMRANEVFGGLKIEGWVQVTSPTPGLTGSYLTGDFTTTLEGAGSSAAFLSQVVPVIRNDPTNKTELFILNPGSAASNVAIKLFNGDGAAAGTVPSQIIAPHAALRLTAAELNASPGTLSAAITASVPVAATAIIDRADSLLFVPGQTIDSTATVRVVPQFLSGNGFDSVLVLTNPNASPVRVTFTLMGDSAALAVTSFTIPANGSYSPDARALVGQQVITPIVTGWLRIDSPNVALAGVLILDQSQAVTSVPVQTAPLNRMIFSEFSGTDAMYTSLSLVNSSGAETAVDFTFVRTDGLTFAKKSVTIPAASKYTALIQDMVEGAGDVSGYVVVRSSVPIYGVEVAGDTTNKYLAGMAPNAVPDAFTPGEIAFIPSITRIEPAEIRQGITLRVSIASLTADEVFILGGQVLPAPRQLAPGIPQYQVEVPAVEPGFINLVVRSNDIESAPVPLRVLSADNAPTQTLSGKAFYQKIDVTDSGLELGRPVMVPVRSARVEVFSRSTQSIVAVSETDVQGRYSVPVPLDPNLTVRVVSRLRSLDLKVEDNTNLNAFYTIAKDIDGRDSQADLLLTESSPESGAFNILEMIQRGNEMIKVADPRIALPPVTIFWSTRNRKGAGSLAQGFIPTTMFNIANNTAYVLGDRNEDSDEFDDAVIVHEYAHLLAAKFSRDDSPGGSHSISDMLDPRVAWSEGWANFFSSAVRNDSIWRDSMGPNGTIVSRFDLEDNNPPGLAKAGYWNEASVQSLLWDLYDDRADENDNVQYPFSMIWKAFTQLRSDRFVYVPYYIEHFIAQLPPAAADAVGTMALAREIFFQANGRPIVTNPFPTAMTAGSSVSGYVDSLTPRRNNLMTSSHFYTFTTAAVGAASIRLDIIGTGPGDNPNANDLDLFLLDANGRVLDRSDRGLNGQSELIAQPRLPAGTYVVEIRSFYTKAETGGFVFNSGQYRLSVSVQ